MGQEHYRTQQKIKMLKLLISPNVFHLGYKPGTQKVKNESS